MELFLILLSLAYAVGLPLVAIVAYSRSSAQRRELTLLSARLQEAERQLQQLAHTRAGEPGAASIAPVAATATPSPAPEPVQAASPPMDEAPALAPTPALPTSTEPEEAREPVVQPWGQPIHADLPAWQSHTAPSAATPAASEQAAEVAPQTGVPDKGPEGAAHSAPDSARDAAIAAALRAKHRARREAVPPATPATPSAPSFIEQGFAAAKTWLLGGNTLVRVGMLLVFLGLAFLLRYASDHVVIPLELRYLAVAGVALAALVLGWRLRERRAGFALLMQGGAAGVIYLTIFSALKLHAQPLIPPGLGFGLLIATVALSGLLAVVQNALSLAMAGAIGGFAAPILVSTGGGSHVALFSYFALLNAGILGIAWFKAWRPLNLVGFFGTFGIGLAWGLRSYDAAAHYASAQGFLLLFFLMFVTIVLLFARRMLAEDDSTPASLDASAWAGWAARAQGRSQRYVDGTLLFGTPLVGFGMQVGLVRHIEYGSAFSALALGLFYLVLARLSLGGEAGRQRLLSEVFLALGVIFGSLAIPLGLDAQWTAAAWAVEGAGLYWIGHRQQRPVARGFALLLQLGATLAFMYKLMPGQETVLAGSALAALMLAAAFLANARVLHVACQQEDAGPLWDRALGPLFLSLGLWHLYAIPALSLDAAACIAAWAMAGAVTVWLGLRLRLAAALPNALVVQALAGLLFFSSELWGYLHLNQLAVQDRPAAFLHLSFWAPLLLALAGFFIAWLSHLARKDEHAATRHVATPALVWGSGWWALAWGIEWSLRAGSDVGAGHAFLATMAISALLAALAARRWQWPALVAVSSLLLPLVALVVLSHYLAGDVAWNMTGGLALVLALLASLSVLQTAGSVWSMQAEQRLHLVNAWVWLGVAAMLSRHFFLGLGEPGSAWRWLGWTLPLAGWLWLNARSAPARLWPFSRYPELYRLSATWPVLVLLLGWVVVANIGSAGSAAPLPYLPLLNPLEIALCLVVLAGWLWCANVPEDDSLAARLCGPLEIALLAGSFLTYTCLVLRGVHHFADVPWDADSMLRSMRAHSALSIAWALLALGLMVAGHRLAQRAVWISGATLVAVVVAKLFFVELSDRGGLERIVSFIGVGVLLLLVGYFAPLPPARKETA